MKLLWKHSYCVVVIAHVKEVSSELKREINSGPVAKKILIQLSNVIEKEEGDMHYDTVMHTFDNVKIAYDPLQGNFKVLHRSLKMVML